MQVGCGLVRQEYIALAGQIGFDYVELMGKYLVSLDEKTFKKLVANLAVSGVECRGINGYCPAEIVIAGPSFDLAQAKRYARKAAGRAKETGASFVGIGSPKSRMLPDGYNRELAKKQLRDFLKTTAEEMGRYGITVCLEALAPCYCNFINYVAEAAEIVREIGWENIRVVADFYNMEYTGEADLDLRPWLAEIVHVHISDDMGSPEKRYFLKEEKKKIHQGRIRKLYRSGYDGAVTIEVDLPLEYAPAKASLEMLRDAV